jgi:muconolactone delta-isomerase
MENGPRQYMVDFTLPEQLSEEFIERIPYQRAAINRLLTGGRVLSYALSLENSKLWTVFSVDSEAELLELISSLPLTRYMHYRFSELTFYNAANRFVPAFSFN